MKNTLKRLFCVPVSLFFWECVGREEESEQDPINSFYGADELWRTGISTDDYTIFEDEPAEDAEASK